jgi:putative PIN family toxin of toxin-antitoxin system
MSNRVVFDTTVVVSSLLFANGRLAWLRQHLRQRECVPLISRVTTAELTRVLAYPKFRLSPNDRNELLADYLPYCELVDSTETCPHKCRDTADQPFLDLAQSGKADLLVTGDHALLECAGQTTFAIETPEAYRRRTFEP